MHKIKLSDIIAPHFYRDHRAIQNHEYTHFWENGGRGSTKSSFFGVEVVYTLIKNPSCHAVVLRKVARTIKDSIFPQVRWAIDMLGLSNQFRFKTSPYEIIYEKTGQKILFLGVDDPRKIKSVKLPFGYAGIVWFEELDQFSGMEELRNLFQSLLRGGDKFWVFCSYNPPRSKDSWVNVEMLQDVPDRMVHTTNYLGVPRHWLGEQFFLEAEKLKNNREDLYRHEYLGEVIGTGGDVFDNVSDLRMSQELIGRFDRLHYGCDFGFAVDPLAFVAVHYEKKHEDIYIFDEIYKYSYDTRPAAEEIKQKAGRRLVIGDSAEPRTIQAFKNLNVNMRGAKKGPDSVDHGIKWLQERRHIYIDKVRCPNTYREFVGYEYARNKDGCFISRYPDVDNHAIDAVRYAMESESIGDIYSF